MSEPIACNLIGNASDYLLLAGEQAKVNTPRMLKHAIATCGQLIAGEPLPGDHCQECWDQKMERD